MSEVRAKSAVAGADTDSQAKGFSSKPSYEAIMQQIAYLMSVVANQTNLILTRMGDAWDSNPMEMVSIPPLHFKDLTRIKRI